MAIPSVRPADVKSSEELATTPSSPAQVAIRVLRARDRSGFTVSRPSSFFKWGDVQVEEGEQRRGWRLPTSSAAVLPFSLQLPPKQQFLSYLKDYNEQLPHDWQALEGLLVAMQKTSQKVPRFQNCLPISTAAQVQWSIFPKRTVSGKEVVEQAWEKVSAWYSSPEPSSVLDQEFETRLNAYWGVVRATFDGWAQGPTELEPLEPFSEKSPEFVDLRNFVETNRQYSRFLPESLEAVVSRYEAISRARALEASAAPVLSPEEQARREALIRGWF